MRTDLTDLVGKRVEASAALQRKLLDPERRVLIARAAVLIAEALRDGGKLIAFGNGGSAADAQRIAAGLVGRYRKERRALPAVALGGNASTLTAVADDYSFEDVFRRQVEALCRPGDVVLAISTSGDSPNVLAGVEAANAIGARTVGLTGSSGGKMRSACDECIRFPSDEMPRIHEGHTLIGQILCEIVESELAA